MIEEFVYLAALVPLSLLTVAIMVIPGLLVLLPIGMPIASAVALAPAVGLVPLSLVSVAFAALGIPWNLTTASAAMAAAWVISWLVGRRFRFGEGNEPRHGKLFVMALAAALIGSSLLTLVALYRGMGSVGTASQGWDPIFHMNAVQWIRESEQASPWSVSPIFRSGGAYYPVGWHLIVSLIPADVVTASNISTLVIGSILWPISITYLTSVIFPQRRSVWLLAPVLAASYISFPYAQLVRSGQWPNGFGTILVPAALGMLIIALRLLFRPREHSHSNGIQYRGTGPTVLVATLALTGTAAAHPGALMAAAVAAVPFSVAYCFPWVRDIFRHNVRHGAVAVLAGMALVTAAIAVLAQSRLLDGVMRYNRSVRGELPESITFALFDLATFPVLQAPDVEEFNLWVGLLAIAGAVGCLIGRGHRSLAVAWLTFVLLHILAAGPENPARWLTGFWYKDTQRISPMIAMTGALLAGWTIDQLTRAVVALVQRVRRNAPSPFPLVRSHHIAVATSLILVAAIYIASDNFRSAERIAVTAKNYSVDANGMGVLSAGEQSFIDRSARLLPEDAVVIGDPFNGETYFYTLAKRRVVYAQLGSATAGHEAKEHLRTSFRNIHTDPSVCRSLERLGVTHFYEDRPGVAHASDGAADWPGFYGTPAGQGFEVVARQGPHTLYRITACE